MQNSINVKENQKCLCNSCKPGPAKVYRHSKQRVEIITGDSYSKVQDRCNRFMDFIHSYGARVIGIPLSTAVGTVDEVPYTQFTLCVSYEVPNNVDDKIMIGAHEKQ